MNTHKVTEIFIGDGSALPAGASTIAPASVNSLGIYGGDMTALTAGDTITNNGSIFLVNKLANGDLKKSMEIKGTGVTGYKGISYAPAAREVWSIGYNRLTAVGDITANIDTDYTAAIRFKNDKIFYSERPEVLSINFRSSGTATNDSIADQIVSAINNSGFGSGPNPEVVAVKVGDGLGAFGLTGATAFGVEITGLNIKQFQNTSYQANYVYFSVSVDDSTGFDTTTTCDQIQAFTIGSGTYNATYNKENFYFQYEGVLNRVKHPIPTLDYLTNKNGVVSGTIAAFTSATVTGEDTVTFSAASNVQLPAGSLVTLDGVAYEIKYYISATVAVITAVATTTNLAGLVTATAFYDNYVIEFTDVTTTPGANVGQFAKKVIVIAVPAIDAGATIMTTVSTEGAAVEAILNPYLASTPGAFAAITL